MQKYNYSNKSPNKINKNLSKNDKLTQPELFANHLAAYDCMDFKSSEGQIIACNSSRCAQWMSAMVMSELLNS